MTPFYDLYPKDPVENLRWRIRCSERAIVDIRFRELLYQACMEDVLFFMAFACWSFEPRAKVKIIPFIPWPHQENVFVAIDAAVDRAETEGKTIDVIVDKARAQGGTFGYLWVDLRRWLRDRMFSAGYVTRNESLVDSKTDSDTLFWKLDWAINRFPFWMVPKGFDWKAHRSYSNHSLLNPANGASLVGYAAGQDVGTGGRKTVFTIDEAGARDFVSGNKDEAVQESLHDVTNCLRLVSARYVDSGVFHNACENRDSASDSVYLVLDWKDNPIHGKHSYTVRDGARAVKPEDQAEIDKYHAEHPDLRARLERRGFKFEGRVRSPWYDMRCLRPTSTPRLIASQLDRDPRGAVGKAFPTDLLDRAKKGCKTPIWQGVPVFDSEDLTLTGLLKREDGPLKLWFKPGIDNSAPFGPFTVGCDMASGSDGAYSSNSVAQILDDRTGEQVGEYAIKGMPLIKFARVVVGLCLWLRNAFLGWEDSGMAGPFAKEIMEVICYGNVHYREVPEIGSRRKSRKAGWSNRTNEDKALLFERMALGMETGRLTVRSEELIKECGEYEWEDGKIIHAPTKNQGAKEVNHGDRAISMGGAWMIYSEEEHEAKIDTAEQTGETPQYGSFLWREQQERRRPGDGSPQFGIRDVVLF